MVYLKRYQGEGIQHIAVGAKDIYKATDKIALRGIQFMKGLLSTYYEQINACVSGHKETLDRLEKNGNMIDGEGVVAGRETRILLQISVRRSSVQSSMSLFSAKAMMDLETDTSKPFLKASKPIRSNAVF